MRAGRAITLGVAALLGLILAGIWIIPGMLDWTRYRDSIAALATSGLGRPVRIGGGVTLHLLPQPILTANRIEVDDTGDGVVLTADALRLRVALGPLLAGRIDARDLTIQGADLHLPWPPAPGALAQRPPAWLTGLSARLERSRITVGTVGITGIDARITTDPETGALSAAGAGQLMARDWRFTARLSRPSRDGFAGLELSLDGQNKLRDTGGTFSGQIGADGALAGRVAGRGADLSALIPAPPVPWRADGRLSAAGGLAVADELAVEIDGSPARGALALRVAPDLRLDVALAAGRLDLDAWAPVLLRGPDIALSMAMPTGLDLSAEAARFAGGTLRRLRGAFDLSADGVTARELTALLPGDAQLTLSGRIAPGTVTFEGSGRVAAPDLRTTLAWAQSLAAPLAWLAAAPGPLLRTADLAATVSLAPTAWAITDLRGTLDGTPIEGTAKYRAGPRPNLAAALTLDRLALDPWLPPDALPSIPGLIAAHAQALAADADLKLDIHRGTWRGTDITNLLLDAQSDPARLTLRRFEATIAGIKLTAAGTAGEGARLSDTRIDLDTADATPLRALLPSQWVAHAGLLAGPATATLVLAGPPDALAARVTAEIADVRIEAQPTIALATGRWSGPATLRHPGAPRALTALGWPGLAAWLGDGSLSAVMQLAAAPGRFAIDSIDLAAGTLRTRGQLTFENHTVTGTIAAETMPWPPLDPRSRDPLPLEALLGWQADLKLEAAEITQAHIPILHTLATTLSLKDGTLLADALTATLAGGTLAGTFRVEAGREPPLLTLHADLANIALTGAPDLIPGLDLTSGALTATLDTTATGHSPAALLATLSGPARADLRGGTLAGIDLPAATAALTQPDPVTPARAALLSGTTPFDSLALATTLQRGAATLDGTLTSPDGTATITGTIDLPGLTTDLRLVLHPTGGPDLPVRLTGPTRTPELAALTRWLSNRDRPAR